MSWVTLIACAAGLLLSLHLGLEHLFPWGAGCPQGWFFNCHVVRESTASVLLGFKLWVWGAAWFITLAGGWFWSRRAGGIARGVLFVVLLLGWTMISHLRGVELFVLHAACAQCWLVALCALVAGVGPLVHTLASQSRPGRAVSLTALVVAMGGGFFAASLLPKPPPPVEPAEIEIPGWQLVLPTTDPADSAEFLLCEPGQPNLLLVIDPECPDCRDLINGLLAEEHVQLYLQDCCRVATIFDNVVTSPFMDGISTTPALLLLSDDGEVVERVVGHIGEDEILALLDSAYQMM